MVCVASILLYSHFGGGWGFFAFLILFPDLGMLGYLANSKIGNITYNLLHFYLFPLACIAYHIVTGQTSTLFLASFIWTAHIGADRFLGFGLKYYTNFKDTHLQRI